MMRRVAGLVACCVAFCPSALAQTIQLFEDAKLPRFEVASVKSGDPNANRASIGTPPRRFVQQDMNLISAIAMAFAVRPYQMFPPPDFVQRERFSIDARMPEGATQIDLPLMVRALLIDRFKLRYHIDRKEEEGYVLVLARRDGRLGPKLHASPVDRAARIAAQRQNQPLPALPPGAAACGIRNGPGLLNFGGMPFSLLVTMLSNQTGKPVVDQTGLTGNYDVELRFSLESLRPPPASPDGLPPAPDDAPSIFTAVQEQLGLKLESGKAPVDHLIIDHIERPDPD